MPNMVSVPSGSSRIAASSRYAQSFLLLSSGLSPEQDGQWHHTSIASGLYTHRMQVTCCILGEGGHLSRAGWRAQR